MTEKLLENLVKAQEEYSRAHITLYNSIERYFEEYDADAGFKVILDEFNFIRVRCTVEIDKNFLNGFCKDFNLQPSWYRKEHMIDYRNVDPVDVVVYEYAFMSIAED